MFWTWADDKGKKNISPFWCQEVFGKDLTADSEKPQLVTILKQRVHHQWHFRFGGAVLFSLLFFLLSNIVYLFSIIPKYQKVFCPEIKSVAMMY